MTHSLSVAPLYLLFKDHKGWSVSLGGAPPSRPVASAGSGQNDHMSETISQMLEPVANTWKKGMEVNSTQDFISKMDKINEEDRKLEDIDLDKVDMELALERGNGSVDEEEDDLNLNNCDNYTDYEITTQKAKSTVWAECDKNIGHGRNKQTTTRTKPNNVTNIQESEHCDRAGAKVNEEPGGYSGQHLEHCGAHGQPKEDHQQAGHVPDDTYDKDIDSPVYWANVCIVRPVGVAGAHCDEGKDGQQHEEQLHGDVGRPAAGPVASGQDDQGVAGDSGNPKQLSVSNLFNPGVIRDQAAKDKDSKENQDGRIPGRAARMR